MHLVLIQYAQDTGRYHPAFYRYAPFPGSDPNSPLRYKSGGHRTKGFDSLEAAQKSARELSERLGAKVEDTYPVKLMAEAGADIIIKQGEVYA